MKKTVIVDVIVVNSVTGLRRWEGGEGGKNQRVGQLLTGKGPEWMGIRHHEQDIGPPSKVGISLFLQGVRLRIVVHCVNINEISVCRLKINHAWSAFQSCI